MMLYVYIYIYKNYYYYKIVQFSTQIFNRLSWYVLVISSSPPPPIEKSCVRHCLQYGTHVNDLG